MALLETFILVFAANDRVHRTCRSGVATDLRLFRRLRVIRQMDSENDLRRAEELVAEGRRIVQQQKGRIVRLRAAGVDTWDAERALRLFEANLRRLEEHRDILKGRK